MFKKIMLATAFCGALTLVGFGTASTVEAGGCYRGGPGYYGPGPAYGYGGYAPRGVSYYRGVSRGPVFGYGYDRGYGYPGYGYRSRGVSFSFGF